MMPMIKEEELVAAGAEKLAHILLSLYENRLDLRKYLDCVFAGLEANPKKLIAFIKKELTALKKSTRFIDYYAAGEFCHRLELLRSQIADELGQKSPNDAFELMLTFLDLHEAMLNRVDDSNGGVGNVFMQACQDLGRLCTQARESRDIVTLIYERFMHNDYGIYDDIIHHFKDALGKEGLEALKSQLQNGIKSRASDNCIKGLKDIADCQKDVDAYIRVCSIQGVPAAYEHLEIAKRLVDQWRGKEALKWLDSMDIPETHGWQHDRYALKLQALELCGEYEAAQVERLAWFEKTLCVKTYGQILQYANSDFKESFTKAAIQRAFSPSAPHLGLHFLIQIHDFENAAKFVRHFKDTFYGRCYSTLRPAADLLKESDPLAAILLYRKLLEAVLQEAKSKYYPYAAKDLVMCAVLSSKVTDWEECIDHTTYYNGLLATHKRKLAFWSAYKTALHKQVVKAVKKNKQGK
jgi:Family of unknown function (DUF6880)